MHRFVNAEDIMGTVTPSSEHDLIIASGAWGDAFLDQYFGVIQRNHKLCRDNVKARYEYVFFTTTQDYEKYKDQFVDPDITFIFKDNYNHVGGMNGVQIDYACKRGLPLVLLAADCFHTPNLIPNLLTKFEDKTAVCVMAQRMFPELLDAIKVRESEIPYEQVFEPREFLRLCLPNLHQRERRYFMDSYRATGTYGSMMHPMRRDGVLIGILVRSFHLGVIFIRNPIHGLQGGFLDSNPFMNKLASPETIGMVTDSDDGFCVDICGDINDHGQDDMPLLADLSQITKCWQGWRGSLVTDSNESLMGYNIALHTEPLNQDWFDLAEVANGFVTQFYGGEIKNKELDWRMLE